jgi:hypothetical protein
MKTKFKFNLTVIFLFYVFFALNVFSRNNVKIFFVSDNSTECTLFIKGLKSYQKINPISKIKKADIILTCGNISTNFTKKLQKPVLKVFSSDFFDTHKNLTECFLIKFPPFKKQISKIRTLFGSRQLKIGLLLHNQNIIKYIRRLDIKNLKIFEVKKIFQLPFVLDKALKYSDCLLLYPDKYISKNFITEFIIKKTILSGKPYVAYSDYFLDYGARFIFSTDYFKEGTHAAMLIVKKIYKRKKIFYPKYIKIKINKDFIK